jgi:hypothetical protein
VSFGFSFSRPLDHSLGGRDGRLGRLDDSVTAAFGQDVPRWAEVYLVWVFGGDSHGAALVDLSLPPAVVLRDLADLQRKFRLVVTEGQTEDFERPLLSFGRGERLRLGFAGQIGAAI